MNLRDRTKAIIKFYRSGFSSMPDWGRKVWFIILVKLVIMFGILKIFFFPDFLKRNFDKDSDRGDYVMEQLIKKTDTYD